MGNQTILQSNELKTEVTRLRSIHLGKYFCLYYHIAIMEQPVFSLDNAKLPDNPFELLHQWIDIKKSLEAEDYWFANASLATIDEQGYPDSRMMALKEFHDDHIMFSTPLTPNGKASQLDACPKAALNFYWGDVGIQIRMKGDTKKISDLKADAFFATRGRWLQEMAHSWLQSNIINDREQAKIRREEIRKKFEGKEIPRPSTWGGYNFYPHTIEFWLKNHRVRYRKVGESWIIEELYP